MINERFIILSKLGEGRSRVFKCKDLENPQRSVAIKILSKDAPQDDIIALDKEFSILKKLNHPLIIKAYEKGEILSITEHEEHEYAGARFIILEQFDGTPLSKFNKISETNFIEIVVQLCRVLFYLHQSNYLYYDIKPENILVKNNGTELNIKLIDFGLTENLRSVEVLKPAGTAEYIAPEILQKGEITHRADIYSLGVLLYKLIYKSERQSREEDIYLATSNLNEKIELPESSDYPVIAKLLPKLLAKTPEERYSSALNIITDMGRDSSGGGSAEFTPAKTFAGRNDIIKILLKYIEDEESDEIFALLGSEGAGKTTIGDELRRYLNNLVVIVKEDKAGPAFFESLLKSIIYTPALYMAIDEETRRAVHEFKDQSSIYFLEKLKALIKKITQQTRVTLFLDDFYRYDNFVIEVIKELLPIFQSGGSKIIITLDSDAHFTADFIHNLREISLTPFTESQLDDYLLGAYFNLFPTSGLKKLILMHADLLPGNIELFIKDALLFGIIDYEKGVPEIKLYEDRISLLKQSHEDIYKMRLASLNETELRSAQYLSLFSGKVEKKVIVEVAGISDEKINEITSSLIQKNILSADSENGKLLFSSEGFKKYTYFSLQDKKHMHERAAGILELKFKDYARTELAQQYELACDYNKAAVIYMAEAASAESLAAYSYKRKVLEHLSSYSLSREFSNNIKVELLFTLNKLGESGTFLRKYNELSIGYLNANEQAELLLAEADALVDTGKIAEGIKKYNSLLESGSYPKNRESILIKIARADIDLNNYDESQSICKEIINTPGITDELLAQSHNIMALAGYYKHENIDEVLENFRTAQKYFTKSGNKLGQSQMYLNIGNIYNMKKMHDMSRESWEKALEINRAIGNLDQEARLLMNFGILYFERYDFDKAVLSYAEARSIFVSLGNRNGEGMLLTNLGEIYTLRCQYQKAFEAFSEALKIFREIANQEEELEALFLMNRMLYQIGEKKMLQEKIEAAKKIVHERGLSKKYEYKMKVSQYYLSLLNQEDVNLSDLEIIRSEFLENEDFISYFNLSSMIIKNHIDNHRYNEAQQLMETEDFVKVSNSNPYSEAERIYLTGLLYEKSDLRKSHSCIEYYNAAYDIIKELDIIELTWKILFSMTEQYFNRGIIRKAKEFSGYTKSLLNQIGEDLKDFQLKNSYFGELNRKNALEKIDYFEKHF